MCEDCDKGVHGLAEIHAMGFLVCVCCRAVISPGLISKGQR
jgi:hypothetical protein